MSAFIGALIEALRAYEAFVLALCLALAGFALLNVIQAQSRLGRTLFGVEKLNVERLRLWAIVGLVASLVLLASVAFFNRTYSGAVLAQVAPTPTPTVAPTTTAIAGNGPLRVNSAGCENPDITIQQPVSGATLSESFEILGTASPPRFGFLRVEIGGAATGGAWVTLGVYTGTVSNGPLLRDNVDPSAYAAGDYIMRLVVTDNVGDEYAPCEILVTLQPRELVPE
jgi:hypothetical protein